MLNKHCEKQSPGFSWDTVDTVLLDMDGTLLDKHFDDYFWEQYVPEHYSLLHNISVEESKKQLLDKYKKVENTLNWADTLYWSEELGLDIPELKMRINHLIGVHPYVIEFLEFCVRKRKKLYLITNAHSTTLSIKLKQTAIGPWFDRILCAEEVGFAKEEPEFWDKLEVLLKFEKDRTLLVDDTEEVLAVAQDFGIGHLLYLAKPSSRKRTSYSCRFPSIEFFKELFPRE
ncbi:HAD family hydrolase [Desulfogranum japonicum]|uniref:HAD family hydrolase n=1 Tax=Desulfogranum japonicum TaxID=231447 RepID=UPI000413DA0E|nr:HAD family hydrolase [Desulfogranum japonicum]